MIYQKLDFLDNYKNILLLISAYKILLLIGLKLTDLGFSTKCISTIFPILLFLPQQHKKEGEVQFLFPLIIHEIFPDL